MNKQEKKEFIENLIEDVKTEILTKINQIPEDWNGVELRMYIADKFIKQSTVLNGDFKNHYIAACLANDL